MNASRVFRLERLARLQRWLRWQISYDAFLSDMRTDPNPRVRDLIRSRSIAFIHVPKTGGTSLCHAIYGEAIGHRTWEQIRGLDPEGFEGWLKIAVVREPVDRFISAYDYLARGGNNEFDRHFARLFVNVDIDTLARRLAAPDFAKRLMAFWHFRPQVDFVVSADRLIMVDRLIPFERMASCAGELGFHPQRLNVTPGIRSHLSDLSDVAIESIRTTYAADLALHRMAQTGTSSYCSPLTKANPRRGRGGASQA